MLPFSVHYTDEDIEREVQALRPPESFLFGTATCGYQAEGGFNGLDEPKNNWYPFEITGKNPQAVPGYIIGLDYVRLVRR